MKKIFRIKGMHCNSCAMLIEEKLKDKVNHISVSYSKSQAEIDFDENKISEKEIKEIIKKCGYEFADEEKKENKNSDKFGWMITIGAGLVLIFMVYYFVLPNFNLPNISVPNVGDNVGLILLFAAGLLTGFHCVSMCGGFVVSYTAKNAINGHKSFTQHLVYGGSKVISYTIIGGIFGLIGGLFAFSIGLRGYVAIFAGLFMVFYALSMFGIGFFKKFQFNPKFLTKAAVSAGSSAKGPYKAPLITGLLNGLFIACGPLQAMYLYAMGTGSFISGATSLMAFGLGTLPVMLGFGSLATVISHNTTKKILKISAIIVLILGLIMLNRGLALTGSNYDYDSIKAKFIGGNSNSNIINSNNNVVVNNGVQEVNMDVSGSGYSPNSFVLKKGVPVKWNVNVKQLTGCNSELVSNEYKIDARLKQGLNTFEFTPSKTGTFSFTCGMGMLRGSFIVTETGTASQEQIKSATPAKGMQCGGSGGGGCGCGG
ncbi:MAG: sulfite exporter TauE/SafE family protein [archaeon]|nr:sulfite exporter TauE/SafE family protein [archaeon]